MRLPIRKQYPKKILVNNEEYTIKFVRVVDKEDGATMGTCDPSSRVIKIRTDLDVATTFATFVHEILHAIEFEHNLDIKHSMVYKLEKALVDLFLTNF